MNLTKKQVEITIQIALILGWSLAILVFARRTLFPISNFDLWWHLAAGRAMAESGSILRADIFSHTMAGASWINFEWLAQALFFTIYETAGWCGLIVFRVFMTTISLALLIGLLRLCGAKNAWLLLGALAGFELLRPRLFVRPELATLVFFPLALVLHLRWSGWKPSVRKWNPAILFILTAVWTNLHGGFVYGIAAAGLLLLGDVWANGRTALLKERLAGLGAMAAGSLVNPFGWKIYLSFIQVLKDFRDGPVLLQEWKPPAADHAPFFWVLYTAAAIVLGIGLLRRARDIRYWAPLTVFFLVMAGTGYRSMALSAFILLPFLAVSFPIVFPRRAWSGPVGAAAAFVFLMTVAARTTFALPKTTVQWSRYPVDAAWFLPNNNLKGPIYNSYHHGGYLEFFLGDQYKVFMDGRYIFYPLLMETARISLLPGFEEQKSRWQELFDQYSIQTAIVWLDELSRPSGGRAQGEAMFPEDAWALVYWDDQAGVFVRRTTDRRAWIESHEYNYLKPYAVDQTRDLRKELERHKSEVPFSAVRFLFEN